MIPTMSLMEHDCRNYALNQSSADLMGSMPPEHDNFLAEALLQQHTYTVAVKHRLAKCRSISIHAYQLSHAYSLEPGCSSRCKESAIIMSREWPCSNTIADLCPLAPCLVTSHLSVVRLSAV